MNARDVRYLRQADAKRSWRWISNHDSGEKAVAFEYVNQRDIVIDGRGARLAVVGRVIPFWIEGCRNITLRNFVIDWQRPFVSHGVVLDAQQAHVDIEIDRKLFPFHVAGKKLIFTGEEYESSELHNLLAFDPKTRAPAVGARDQYHACKVGHAVDLGDGVVRWVGPWNGRPEPGQLMTFQHDHRDCPAIVLTESQNVLIEDVVIYHAGGMGVIGQRCEDVTLSRVTVAVEEDSPRVVSTFNDATHFVGCRGLITLSDSRFERQLDDATNIHGMYGRVANVARNEMTIDIVHRQQAGFAFAKSGDRIVLRKRATLEPLAEFDVEDSALLGGTQMKLTSRSTLPDMDLSQDELVVSNASWQANAQIMRCHIADNRARGILLSSGGRIRVTDNYFSTLGPAIASMGGCTFWYEDGLVRDLEISGNTFDNCYRDMWGKAVIDLRPEGMDVRTSPMGHENIRIMNNRFIAPGSPIVAARNITGLTLADNRVETPLESQGARSTVQIDDTVSGLVDRNNDWAIVRNDPE